MMPNSESLQDEDDFEDEGVDPHEQAKEEAKKLLLSKIMLAGNSAFECSDDVPSTSNANRIVQTIYKPDCSELESAIEIDLTGEAIAFKAEKGKFIIVEYTKHDWWSTTRYEVCKVKDNGDLLLWNPLRVQYAMSNWKNAATQGVNMFLENKKLDLEKKPRKNSDGSFKQPTPQIDPTLPKKRRGRPKGSKNKSTLIREAKQQTIIVAN